ncbi:preprotein translocase subunit YajC [Thiomicrospira sp. R3]|uniref:preprotein translocase subunit YajC n=1 Tax=Thiomicrospira sp. R3 TaxID=3035472 RepID=UPI00259B4ABE|nr:preprotein translocase subunit YajC [Thiomicrospira sp. R3]WFE67892.1 preprotein translocase subunit YajC [Thiomicrospira sp. R3]
MDFFISNAMADGGGFGGAGWEGLIPLILLFVIFYFLLIRPQQKKVKEHRKLVSEVQKGDEIITYGGIGGKIRELDEAFCDLEIAPNVVVKVDRQNIARLLPKGTLKGTATKAYTKADNKSTRNDDDTELDSESNDKAEKQN